MGGQVGGVVEEPGRVADLLSEEVRGWSVRGEVVRFAGALVCVAVVGLKCCFSGRVHVGKVGVGSFGPHSDLRCEAMR